jgi:phospholipase C
MCMASGIMCDEAAVPPKDNIKHVVVLMLENRSFDHMFGALTIDQPHVPGDAIDGLTGDEVNLDSAGNPVVVSMDARYAGDYRVDPGHHFPDVTQQLFEHDQVPSTATPTMGGFVRNYQDQPGGTRAASHRVMKCFDPDKLPALCGLAREFAVCDRWFSSVPGPTLPNRAFAHAATSLGHVDMNPIAYWNVMTLYERLDQEGVSSRVYSHDGNTLGFMFKTLFKKGGKYLGSYGDFLSDLKGNKLPKYCFVEPRFNDWYDAGNHRYYIANDQHPDNNVAEGELLIREVYENIRKSKYWEKCLFVIVYDEHGGFFDHVKPPTTIASGQESGNGPFDFQRLGVRVPAILVSPYIAKGTLIHDQLEHSSLAATARDILAPNMAALTNRDKHANSFANVLTLTAPRDTPRKLAMSVDGADLRPSDIDANTHGAASLSDQQRNQVLAAYMMDLDRPAGERVIGNGDFTVLEDIDTEQKAAEYIQAVAASMDIP